MLQARHFKWLPNAITLVRIACGAIVLFFAIREMWVVAFWLYLGALASDFLDGLAAKKLNAASKLGELLDSLADGWLATVGLVSLSATGHLSWWVTTLAIALGAGVQAERRLMHGKLSLSAVFKKMFAIIALFGTWIYIVLAFADQAYGWHWWYILLTAATVVVLCSLKRHRLRAWVAGRSEL